MRFALGWKAGKERRSRLAMYVLISPEAGVDFALPFVEGVKREQGDLACEQGHLGGERGFGPTQWGSVQGRDSARARGWSRLGSRPG